MDILWKPGKAAAIGQFRRFMTLINLILNVAGVLLWLNWRVSTETIRVKPGQSLLSTLRPLGHSRWRFYNWMTLPLLLIVRALIYWQVGRPVYWNPVLKLGPAALAFRSDLFSRMLLFSLLSFLVALGLCYLWLLWLSWLSGSENKTNKVQRLVTVWLGRMDRCPGLVRWFAPFAASVAGWMLFYPLFRRLDMVPIIPMGRLMQQGLVIGCAAALSFALVIIALQLFYLLNSYVYLGDWAFWQFVNTISQRLLNPLRKIPLRAGKVDLAPVLMFLIAAAVWIFGQRELIVIYRKLL